MRNSKVVFVSQKWNMHTNAHASLSLTLSTFSEERADAFADAEDPAEVVEEMRDQIIIEMVDILG